LHDRGIAVEERDMAKRPLTAEELDRLIGDAPELLFLNPRNKLFRERGFKENPPDRAEAIRLMAEHPNLIRRPILFLFRPDRVLFGFAPEVYELLGP
jgi:arsenate reductase-like glutaredoxin family protein